MNQKFLKPKKNLKFKQPPRQPFFLIENSCSYDNQSSTESINQSINQSTEKTKIFCLENMLFLNNIISNHRVNLTQFSQTDKFLPLILKNIRKAFVELPTWAVRLCR